MGNTDHPAPPLADRLRQWAGYLFKFARGVAARYGLDFEDTRQELLLFVVERDPAYDPARGAFSTWLALQCLGFASRMRERWLRRVPTVRAPDDDYGAAATDSGPGPPDRFEADEVTARVRAAVAALPDAQRRAVEAHFWHGARLPRNPRERRVLDAGLAALRVLLTPADAGHLEPAA
jgi:DNA-directed RNA polymerase specialized sigma24 family protein